MHQFWSHCTSAFFKRFFFLVHRHYGRCSAVNDRKQYKHFWVQYTCIHCYQRRQSERDLCGCSSGQLLTGPEGLVILAIKWQRRAHTVCLVVAQSLLVWFLLTCQEQRAINWLCLKLSIMFCIWLWSVEHQAQEQGGVGVGGHITIFEVQHPVN